MSNFTFIAATLETSHNFRNFLGDEYRARYVALSPAAAKRPLFPPPFYRVTTVSVDQDWVDFDLG